jgi:DNA-binding CsgD family transcriptional regulator
MSLRQATQDRQSTNVLDSQALNPANDHFGGSMFYNPTGAETEAETATSSTTDADMLVNTLAACALDAMASGVIIIDQYARVLHLNAAATEALANRSCMALDSGHITVTHMPDVRQFSKALGEAAAGKRSMVAMGARSDALVAVVPLYAQHGGSAQHFALIFSRTDMCEALSLKPFASAYELTPTEERVLALISTGQTVPQMAKSFNLGAATIRTHVRNICHKTNCHGLREIVTRLAVLPALKIKTP